MPANSVVAPLPSSRSHHGGQVSVAKEHCGASDPDESTTAISKAAAQPPSSTRDVASHTARLDLLEGKHGEKQLEMQRHFSCGEASADGASGKERTIDDEADQRPEFQSSRVEYDANNAVRGRGSFFQEGHEVHDNEGYSYDQEILQHHAFHHQEETADPRGHAMSGFLQCNVRQPAFSVASAVVGDLEARSPVAAAAMLSAPATSLTSQHIGPRDVLNVNEDHPHDELVHGQAAAASAAAMEGTQSCQGQADMAPPALLPVQQLSVATDRSRIPNNMLMTAAVTPQQLNNMVAAWSRQKSSTPRRGESSNNSGNYRVLVGLKRKSSVTGGGTGRPPMAPPVHVVHRAPAPVGSQGTSVPLAYHAPLQTQPSVSSLGGGAGGNVLDDGHVAIEDAVSMVEHGLEGGLDVDVACDAISKASDDAAASAAAAAHERVGGSAEEVQGRESCGMRPSSCNESMEAQQTSRASIKND